MVILENTININGDYKGNNETEPGQRHSNKKYRFPTERKISFLKPKDDRTYGERVDDRLEAGYRGAKAIRKTVKMRKRNANLNDITKESEEMQIEALKEATRS